MTRTLYFGTLWGITKVCREYYVFGTLWGEWVYNIIFLGTLWGITKVRRVRGRGRRYTQQHSKHSNHIWNSLGFLDFFRKLWVSVQRKLNELTKPF